MEKPVMTDEEISALLSSVADGNPEAALTTIIESLARRGIHVQSLQLAATLAEVVARTAPRHTAFHYGAMTVNQMIKILADKLGEHLDQFGRP